MSRIDRVRGGVCVDGFNLYHAIDDLGQPYLKWLDLRKLSEKFARGHAHVIEEIVFCTAFFPGDFGKRKRHEAYNAALEARGVKILKGHTTKEPMKCNTCGNLWDQPREKETDINVALSLFSAAMTGKVDVVFLLTADTDQAATLKYIKEHCPQVKRVVVTPPGREKSKHLRDLSHANLRLGEGDIDDCVLPAMVQPEKGRLIVRPDNYQPPAGWVHPDERPA
ncbi:NYN domain-containing protein [Roseovarius azorensis]|uniref:NYN domain-containing protein n=1 Tax=Roseovarius azorensis TaxID=1287727 RepID=A0A1H7PLM0_9RHOB|nr:NYN domain-containing protein [Roseovarius azorensis]SEL36683.1 NYN domain-containing protein [Roseovarius azorensis]